MFWKRKKGPALPPQIGCFGKLPATGDFVRLNASTEELAAFDRWLGASIDHAKRSLGPAWDQAYQMAVGLFVFRDEAKSEDGPNRGLVGAWAASGDSAGRQYPMVVFASYDYGQLAGTGAAVPIAVWPLLAAAYEAATVGRNMAVDAFLDKVSRIAVPSLEDPVGAGAGYRGWLTTQSMKALWETGYATDNPRFWVMGGLVESLEPFRGQELPRTGLGIRLPLGAGDAYAVAVWLDMTIRIAKWGRTLPNVFWTPQKTAMIHPGAPHVATFRELIAPTGNAEHVAELCGNATVDEGTARRRLGRFEAVVANTDLTLSTFLEAIQ